MEEPVEIIEVSSESETTGINVNNDPRFYHRFERKLTASQAVSKKFHLPAKFVENAIVHARKFCYIEDEEGSQWTCWISWSERTKNECYLTSGWDDFRKSRNLKEGSTVYVGSPQKKNNTIYVKIIH